MILKYKINNYTVFCGIRLKRWRSAQLFLWTTKQYCTGIYADKCFMIRPNNARLIQICFRNT